METIIFDNGAKAIPTELQDCYILEPRYFPDERGHFVADFILEHMQQLGFENMRQHNMSGSSKGVLRGMHFQLDPYAQAKVVGVAKGAVIDIVVDIRVGSPTYGKAIAVPLTKYDKNVPGSGRQLFVPRGFAHGFICVEDETIFQYYVDNKYAPEYEEGIAWNGKETLYLVKDVLEQYKIKEEDLVISGKDQKRLALDAKPVYFEYKAS